MPVRIIALLLLIAHLSCGIAATLAMDTHGHDQNGGITTADSLALGHHCASPSDPDQSRQHQGHGGDAVDGGAGCDHSCHAAAHLLGAPSEYRMPTLAGAATAQSGRDPAWSSRNSNPLIRPPLLSA
jgi:hypothetical protein